MTPLTREEETVLHRKHVQHLLADPRITSWERDFLTDMAAWLAKGTLTDKQKQILAQLTRRYLEAR